MYDATAVFFANYFDFMWSEKLDTSSAPHPKCWLYHSKKFDSVPVLIIWTILAQLNRRARKWKRTLSSAVHVTKSDGGSPHQMNYFGKLQTWRL